MSKTVPNSTQEHLPIAGIQDSVVILNDGSLRAVLKIEPINFELKSETEQNGIIYQYQSFLNSLEFPIQIVIQSKKLDLEQYLIKLEKVRKETSNELLQLQTENYIAYVRQIISIANIMSKHFFVVVGYGDVANRTGISSLTSMFQKRATGPVLNQNEFSRYRTELSNRVNTIGSGLSRLGVQVRALNTQQLIELFYTIYNPDIATQERLTNVGELSASVISSEEGVAEAETTPEEEPKTNPEPPAAPEPPSATEPSVDQPTDHHEQPTSQPTPPAQPNPSAQTTPTP